MFKRILIANRGEIACRIIRTCRQLGVETVAVYSDADAGAMHVRLADFAVHIGASEPGESYLRSDRITEAAKATKAQAVHPGYGFLSENAGFRSAIEQADIAFIGPSAATIDAMGSKAEAKRRMEEANVPTVPGYHGADQGMDHLVEQAQRIGFPLMIKAAAGGGGKGMRIVRKATDFEGALQSARREAVGAFGDDRVILEKYLEKPRHIEIQVFGDHYGNVVHLFERDCSTQRRYQKVIEEAPAPGLSEDTRRRMGEAAVAAARAVDYHNAGTVEFIMGQDGDFYFMEMNTRLQVEHPVTELITGLDLVEWQLRIADGQPLPLSQDEITCRGHAFEARLYAEDAAAGFLPSTGHLTQVQFPGFARVDTGVTAGHSVSVFYDPMIAKIVVHSHDRPAALSRLRAALADTEIDGVTTNLDFLVSLAHSTALADHTMHTALLDQDLSLVYDPSPPSEHAIIAASLCEVHRQEQTVSDNNPWSRCDAWRLGWQQGHSGRRDLSFTVSADHLDVQVRGTADHCEVHIHDRRVEVRRVFHDHDSVSWQHDGRSWRLPVRRDGNRFQIVSDGQLHVFRGRDPYAVDASDEGSASQVIAPMPGKIIAVRCAAGDSVAEGDELIVMEAMKMELSLTAPRDGEIAELTATEGDFVEADSVLIRFDE